MTDIDSEELKIYESFDKTFNPINNYFIQKNNERLRDAEIRKIVNEIYGEVSYMDE
jgi:tryptophanase